MEQQELISRAETVAAVVSGRATHSENAVTYQVVFKLPIYVVSRIDAMGVQAGKNRTQMVSMLLAVALDEVSKHVDEPAALRLVQLEAEALGRLMGEVQ